MNTVFDQTRKVMGIANAVICMDCERMMTVFETDKGVCPSCFSKAVYPAIPGFIYGENGLEDARRAG